MTFPARVFRVMIASPSDALEARDAIERAVHSWNDANAEIRQVVLLPWRWETSSVQQMGEHPQALINQQGLERADIVFAIFWGRVGSPTPKAVSGTVEEIESGVAAGKKVHLYFSTAPLPIDVDTAQLDGLRAFRSEVESRGLLGEFHNTDQLVAEVWKCIEADLPALGAGDLLEARPSQAVSFLVQPGSENELKYSSKGVPSTSRRHWIDVTNRSPTTDALEVEFELVGEAAMRVMTPEAPITIHSGQSRRLPVARFFGGGREEPKLRIRWLENDEPKTRDYDVG